MMRYYTMDHLPNLLAVFEATSLALLSCSLRSLLSFSSCLILTSADCMYCSITASFLFVPFDMFQTKVFRFFSASGYESEFFSFMMSSLMSLRALFSCSIFLVFSFTILFSLVIYFWRSCSVYWNFFFSFSLSKVSSQSFCLSFSLLTAFLAAVFQFSAEVFVIKRLSYLSWRDLISLSLALSCCWYSSSLVQALEEGQKLFLVVRDINSLMLLS